MNKGLPGQKGGTSGPSRDWTITLSCFLLTFSVGPFYALGVFFTSFETDFGWSRALISSVHASFLLMTALSNVVFGWLIDRYGVKKLLLLCGILTGLGVSLISQITNIRQLYALYIVASFGIGANYVAAMSTVQRLVSGRRLGLAMGLTSSGMPLARVVYIPAAAILISEVGWRPSYVVLGVAVWILTTLAALLLPAGRQVAAEFGDAAPGSAAPASSNSGVAASEMSFLQIAKTRTFLLAAVLFMFPVIPIHMVMVHLVPFAEGKDISTAGAALAAGLIGAFGVLGNLTLPAQSTRLAWRWLVIITAAGAALVLLWLPAVNGLLTLYLFVAVFGFFSFGNAPCKLGLMRHLFGTRWLASIIGLLTAISALFGALGPIAAGYIYDRTGSYGLAFLIGAFCFAMIAFIAFWLKKPVTREHGAS